MELYWQIPMMTAWRYFPCHWSFVNGIPELCRSNIVVFKGSNMSVCVLFVSNSRGCCLAVPGNHEGEAWCHHFFHSNQYFAHEKQFKVWIESNPLPCHHVIVAASIAVASTPGHENARASFLFFFGRLGVWNRIAPDRRHLLPVATTKLIMRCVYKLNFICTMPIPMKMTSSTQLWYIHAIAGRYVFRWDRLLSEGFGLCSSGSSLVSPMTWRSARARANFKCDVTDVNE